MSVWSTLRYVLIVVALLSTVYNGIWDGLASVLGGGLTPGRRVAVATQVAYGVFAVLSLVAIFVRRHRAMPLLLGWALTTTATALLAPIVWGGAPISVGLLSGAAAAVVTALLLWVWRIEVTSTPPALGTDAPARK